MMSPDAPLSTPKFYGRKAELEKMVTHLSGPPGRKAVVLWGLGSFGKSQLALQFQNLHQIRKAHKFGLTSKLSKHSPNLNKFKLMFLSMRTLLPLHQWLPHGYLYSQQDFRSTKSKFGLKKSQIATGCW